jgi:hypothetical protein
LLTSHIKLLSLPFIFFSSSTSLFVKCFSIYLVEVLDLLISSVERERERDKEWIKWSNYCVINSLTKLKISLNIEVLDKCRYIYLYLFLELFYCVKMTFSIITLLLIV